MPLINPTPPIQDYAPNTSLTNDNIKRTLQQSGFGYALTSFQINRMNSFFRGIETQNIKAPYIWLRNSVCVNPNILTNTDALQTGGTSTWSTNASPTLLPGQLDRNNIPQATRITSSALFSGLFQSVSVPTDTPFTAI